MKTRYCLLVVKSALVMLLATSCSGQSGEKAAVQEDVNEIEVIPKVKEPQSDEEVVDFTEESTGTPITGKQGNPKENLVNETPPDF